VTWHGGDVTAADRERLLGQRGCVVWLTGLSGSGKSTIARALERRLAGRGRLAYVLDGDNFRHGLAGDLGFSPSDRQENIRRAGEVAALLADAGVIAVAAFISPYRQDRQRARSAAPAGRFVEVFVDAPLAECERRDPKGLYRRARAGELADFTGVTAPYEPPESPELVLDAAGRSPERCAADLEACLDERGLLSGPDQDPPVCHRGLTELPSEP
jgi:adenylylsulfate kinase